ncbi:HNH endonuclease [Tellurirhabdus bombi]|uniref:HNH endonuclease n=1 Tax=Tellurirhabdus bombi TaxID=2907205 RepID=UPI001F4441FD|nr:HNH endonuclease signature motif containing protein [Tellurirhabdus bombi]
MAVIQSVKRPWQKARPATPAPQQGRKNPNRKIYATERWKRESAEFRRKNPLCAECLKQDVLTDVTPGGGKGVTDHIIPINQGADPWNQTNWQSLCKHCHNAKSGRDKTAKPN